MRLLLALLVLLIAWSALNVSGYTNPVYMTGSERRCPACGKQSREHKNRDLVFSEINPWETVSNKVAYY